jgi:murein L,D-transpeptidase YcbB/YkuD
MDIAFRNDLKSAARLDVLLTDAMLAFISHLHYGKLAPLYTSATTDRSDFKGLKADSILISALKSTKFSLSVTNVQPDNKQYRELQNMLRLMTGQYTGDSYETDIQTVKLIALNMERMRWEKPMSEPYISINIPAFNLRYYKKSAYQEFKVIVGKPSTPTPVLASSIGYFTTAPDWTVPQKILVKELLPLALKHPGYLDNNNFRIYDKKGNTIDPDPINLKRVKDNISDYIIKQSPGCDNALGKIAFNFPNNYSVYLHDTPDRQLFNRAERAFSHGCIRLEKPEEFAGILLKADSAPEKTFSELHQAMEAYQRKRFTLKTPVPILVRYITCEINNGILSSYTDLYKKDKEISDKLFGSDDIFITEIKEFIKKKSEGFENRNAPV